MYKTKSFVGARKIIKVRRNVIQKERWAMKVFNSKYFRTGNEFLNFSTSDFLGLNRKFKSAAVSIVNSNDNIQSEYSNTISSLQKVFKTKLSLFPDESSVHQTVLEKVITTNDFIVLDEFSNTNLKIAVKHLNNLGVNSQTIPGNDLEKLTEIITSRSSHRGRIWFAGPSIYPVPGKYIQLPALKGLMEQYSNLYLLLDDSYSLGWSGSKGEGIVYSAFPNLKRIVIVASLTKGFGANIGALAVSDSDILLSEKVNQNGWSISNLQQIGSIAELLSSMETSALQSQLNSRINYFHKVLHGHLPCVSDRTLPLCFIPVRMPEMCQEICATLIEEGCYVSSAAYPHTSMDQPGLRINITLNHTMNDIKKMLEALKVCYSQVLKNKRILNKNI